MTEMHDVVEMLLNRMKDYPEDFFEVPDRRSYVVRDVSKWYRAAQMINDVVTEEEKAALHAATLEAKRAVYMGAALKTILSDEEPEDESKPYMTINAAGGLGIGTSNAPIWSNTSASNGITIGSAQLTEDKVKAIDLLEAKQKIMEAQMQRQYAMNTYAGNAAGSALG